MQKLTTIQPGMTADFSLPYPFHVFEDGRVDRQDFWRGNVARIVGFQADLNKMVIDLFWKDAVKDPQRAVGMFVVTSDDKGRWAVHQSAISKVTETKLAEAYVVSNGTANGGGNTLDEAKKNFKAEGGKLSDGYTIAYHLGGREPEVTVKKARAARG